MIKREQKTVKLSEIKPNPDNPRVIKRNQLKSLQKSLNDFPEMMELRPIVVDEDGVILGGNMRYQALLANGATETEVETVSGLTPEQKREFVIKDNVAFGDWDWDALANEWDTDVLEEWGLDIPESEKVGQEVEEVDVPEVADEEPKAKVGDIYQLGRNRLMCGDSSDVAVIDRLMDGTKADMVFTDSPYGVNIVNDKGKVGADNLAKNGVYAPVIGDDTTETAQQAYDIYSQLCDKMILWGGNYFLDFLPPSDGWLIWDKRGESGIRNNFADGEMAWCSFHTPVRIYHQLWNGMIREGEHEKRVHPTQKPIRMLSEILQDFTNEGDIILDVFGGSGSTLIACEQTGRTCYMAELSPEYVDVIIQRWENFTGKKAEKINQ